MNVPVDFFPCKMEKGKISPSKMESLPFQTFVFATLKSTLKTISKLLTTHFSSISTTRWNGSIPTKKCPANWRKKPQSHSYCLTHSKSITTFYKLNGFQPLLIFFLKELTLQLQPKNNLLWIQSWILLSDEFSTVLFLKIKSLGALKSSTVICLACKLIQTLKGHPQTHNSLTSQKVNGKPIILGIPSSFFKPVCSTTCSSWSPAPVFVQHVDIGGVMYAYIYLGIQQKHFISRWLWRSNKRQR